MLELQHIGSAGGPFFFFRNQTVCTKASGSCAEHSAGSFLSSQMRRAVPERGVDEGRALDRSDSGRADISIIFPAAHKAQCWAHHSTHRPDKMTAHKFRRKGGEKEKRILWPQFYIRGLNIASETAQWKKYEMTHIPETKLNQTKKNI